MRHIDNQQHWREDECEKYNLDKCKKRRELRGIYYNEKRKWREAVNIFSSQFFCIEKEPLPTVLSTRENPSLGNFTTIAETWWEGKNKSPGRVKEKKRWSLRGSEGSRLPQSQNRKDVEECVRWFWKEFRGRKTTLTNNDRQKLCRMKQLPNTIHHLARGYSEDVWQQDRTTILNNPPLVLKTKFLHFTKSTKLLGPTSVVLPSTENPPSTRPTNCATFSFQARKTSPEPLHRHIPGIWAPPLTKQYFVYTDNRRHLVLGQVLYPHNNNSSVSQKN